MDTLSRHSTNACEVDMDDALDRSDAADARRLRWLLDDQHDALELLCCGGKPKNGWLDSGRRDIDSMMAYEAVKIRKALGIIDG